MVPHGRCKKVVQPWTPSFLSLPRVVSPPFLPRMLTDHHPEMSRPAPRKAGEGGIQTSFFEGKRHSKDNFWRKTAPRTHEWIQDRTWNTQPKRLAWPCGVPYSRGDASSAGARAAWATHGRRKHPQTLIPQPLCFQHESCRVCTTTLSSAEFAVMVHLSTLTCPTGGARLLPSSRSRAFHWKVLQPWTPFLPPFLNSVY